MEQMADRVEEAFGQHFEVTNDQPTEEEYYRQHADPESTYWWYREGESLPELLEDIGGVPYQAAQDVQEILEERHRRFFDEDFQEQPFSSEALYEIAGVSDTEWQSDWEAFEHTIKTESRFFSRKVYDYLDKVFSGLEKFVSIGGRPLIAKLGPGEKLKGLHRARVFQDRQELLEALKHPDLAIGTPASRFARGGRMNAPGIAVFYGATNAELALAEVRPPVGSKVVVGYFEMLRPLTLLDLTVLQHVRAEGSIFDPSYVPAQEKALFLRNLAKRIALPVMPVQEANDYLPTQLIADFLSEASGYGFDGIIFTSTQSAADGANVVLFNRAARVQEIMVREGSLITSHSTVYEPADGDFESYNVVVQEPARAKKKVPEIKHVYHPTVGFLPSGDSYPITDQREVSLRLLEQDLRIFDIESVNVSYGEISYKRSTIKKTRAPKIPDVSDLDF